MTTLERAILDRLLAVDFPGRDAIAKQLADVFVKPLDEDGSLRLHTRVRQPAVVIKRVPVEAEGIDADGIPISILLHVLDGYVRELEIYRADGAPIIKMPDPQSLDVFGHEVIE